MFEIKRTNSSDLNFITLTKLLDKKLWEQNGINQAKYDEYNFLLKNEKVIVVYDRDTSVGCGSFREFSGQVR